MDLEVSLRSMLDFTLECLQEHEERGQTSTSLPPLVLGVNGLQGIGKTTLVEHDRLIDILHRTVFNPAQVQALRDRLIDQCKIRAVSLSIDDFYLWHEDQLALAAAHPTNPLLQHRGQPGTHDLALAVAVLRSLSNHRDTLVPSYDKSAHDGQGDRSGWNLVLGDDRQQGDEGSVVIEGAGSRPRLGLIRVIILEGWCVGYRALDAAELGREWEESVQKKEATSQLWHHDLENLNSINRKLRKYDVLTDRIDALIHLDTKDLQNVYRWRQEQEGHLRARTGSGMTDAEVRRFVDGYYPSYELYLDRLRLGNTTKGNRLRLILDTGRKLLEEERNGGSRDISS